MNPITDIEDDEDIAPARAGTALRQLIEDAARALNHYKRPDIDEALERIDALLVAALLGSIQHDRVVCIEERSDHFEIQTEWSARGCAQTSEYELPYCVVDAADPMAAAVSWARTQAMAKAQARINEAQSSLCYAQEAYEKACAMPA